MVTISHFEMIENIYEHGSISQEVNGELDDVSI